MAGCFSPSGSRIDRSSRTSSHGVDERQGDHVGVAADKRQVFAVLVGDGWQSKHRIGQIDAFFAGKLRAPRPRACDSHVETVGFAAFHDTPNLPVVEPDGIAGPHVLEDLGLGAANGRGRQHMTAVVANGIAAGCRRPGDNQLVSSVHDNRHFPRGQNTHGSIGDRRVRCTRTRSSRVRCASIRVPASARST